MRIWFNMAQGSSMMVQSVSKEFDGRWGEVDRGYLDRW